VCQGVPYLMWMFTYLMPASRRMVYLPLTKRGLALLRRGLELRRLLPRTPSDCLTQFCPAGEHADSVARW
jgi:hypothetical protein